MKAWHVLFLGAAYMLCNLGPNIWAELHKYDITLQCIGGVEYSHLANGNMVVNVDTNGRPAPCEAQPAPTGTEARF
jgi:hypothetical protein